MQRDTSAPQPHQSIMQMRLQNLCLTCTLCCLSNVNSYRKAARQLYRYTRSLPKRIWLFRSWLWFEKMSNYNLIQSLFRSIRNDIGRIVRPLKAIIVDSLYAVSLNNWFQVSGLIHLGKDVLCHVLLFCYTKIIMFFILQNIF